LTTTYEEARREQYAKNDEELTRYEVEVREIHVSTMEVFAEGEDDAIRRVLDGEGEELGLEYAETIEEVTVSKIG